MGHRGGGFSLSSLPSPSSSSSSDFEFVISRSPSTRRPAAQLCPADELFYKGQLLPLRLSPRVRTLLVTSSSSSSSDATTTASRDSSGSSSSSFSTADLLLLPPECETTRPSSVTEDDARRISRRARYFSTLATRFSSVFLHRGSKKHTTYPPSTNKSTNPSAKQVIQKYVKPLYEKLSSLPQKQNLKNTFSFSTRTRSSKKDDDRDLGIYSHLQSLSFSGNLNYPRRNKCTGSCPSSMGSSPSHSGLLYFAASGFPDPPATSPASSSSMEELQSAIQGAIAHCKSTMIQANQKKASATISSDEIDGS